MPEQDVFTITDSMLLLFEEYTYEELGTLIRGAICYAISGTEPTLDGEERYVWPALKAEIDSQKGW